MVVCAHCQNDRWTIVAGGSVCSECGHPHEPSPAGPSTPALSLGTLEGQVGDPREHDYSGLVKLGYVTAVIVPVVGFILGVAVATRQSRAARHGVRIIVTSLVAFAVFVVVIRAHIISDRQTAQVCGQVSAAATAAFNEPITSLAQSDQKVKDMTQAANLVESVKTQCPDMWKAFNTDTSGSPLPAS
jgi:energy-converting hydrogenase Eha subunit A